MDALSIRPVSIADLPAIVRLSEEHARYESADFESDGQQQRLQEAFFSDAPELFGWVVSLGETPVGYMTATVDFATWTARPFVHMDCIYLQPAFRRKGLGARLVRTLAAFARANGVDLIQWQTPRGNSDGIAFYERLGAIGKEKRRYFLPVRCNADKPDVSTND